MNDLLANKDILKKSSYVTDEDFLSKFRKKSNQNIHYGMTNDEISEIVSEKIISIIKKQFQETKERELASR